jgi:3-hydroxyisobutyrate dehydrogenase/2-hydroxy-3-oxopropionate reductase
VTDVGAGITADVAVVGTGRMGAAMVGRLCGAGHRVTVWNRDPARAARALAGAAGSVAATAREAAAGADIVFVSLADDGAVRRVYGGADGLVAGLRPGAVVLETSTIAPDTVRSLAPHVTSRGATLLDAPVSGSVALVARGAVTMLVGGSAEALDAVRPVVAAIASTVFHLGGPGTGATMKLAVNAVVHALNQALAEALVLAEKAGVDRTLAYDVFAASAVAAPYVAYKRDAFVNPDEAPVAFALDLVAKDLQLIDELAESVGARMDQLAANRGVVAEAVAAGMGARDLSALASLLRR